MQGSFRENPSQAKEYIIPHGDWVEIVSSPHYLAEIVIILPLGPSSQSSLYSSFHPFANGRMLCDLGFILGLADC